MDSKPTPIPTPTPTLRPTDLNEGRYVCSDMNDCCQQHTVITFAPGITSIPWYKFDSCGFTSVVTPEGVRSIDGGGFHNCAQLTDLTLPDSLHLIGFD